jgi:hypothetical protein
MEEYRYKERKILRIYIWSIFVSGTIIVLIMLGFISLDLIKQSKNSDVNSLLIVLIAGILWICISSYFLVNSPLNLVLTDRIMEVNWNTKKRKEYLWQDVSLKKTGLPEQTLILIRDSKWLIPRLVILDGSSKQYRELISRIKEIKHLSEIEQL